MRATLAVDARVAWSRRPAAAAPLGPGVLVSFAQLDDSSPGTVAGSSPIVDYDWPIAATAQKLSVHTTLPVPGTCTIGLVVNGIMSALEVTLLIGATDATVTADVALVAGDVVRWESTGIAGIDNQDFHISLVYDPDVQADGYAFFCGNGSAIVAGQTDRYFPAGVGGAASLATDGFGGFPGGFQGGGQIGGLWPFVVTLHERELVSEDSPDTAWTIDLRRNNAAIIAASVIPIAAVSPFGYDPVSIATVPPVVGADFAAEGLTHRIQRASSSQSSGIGYAYRYTLATLTRTFHGMKWAVMGSASQGIGHWRIGGGGTGSATETTSAVQSVWPRSGTIRHGAVYAVCESTADDRTYTVDIRVNGATVHTWTFTNDATFQIMETADIGVALAVEDLVNFRAQIDTPDNARRINLMVVFSFEPD